MDTKCCEEKDWIGYAHNDRSCKEYEERKSGKVEYCGFLNVDKPRADPVQEGEVADVC